MDVATTGLPATDVHPGGEMTDRLAFAVQRIETAGDLECVSYIRGQAVLEIDGRVLRLCPFRDHLRGSSRRLAALERRIRRSGYRPLEPVLARVDEDGAWQVINGGHRLTAAMRVATDPWANLTGRKVRWVYVVVLVDPMSWSRTTRPDGVEISLESGSVDIARREDWQAALDRFRRARGGA